MYTSAEGGNLDKRVVAEQQHSFIEVSVVGGSEISCLSPT